MGFQNVVIQGNLGKSVELRYTPAGKAVGSFPVAVDEGFGDKKSTTWFNVTVWEKTAEACSNWLQVGSKVLVSGRIQTRTYDDRDGNKRQAWELVANRVEFLESKGEGQGQGGDRGSQPQSRDEKPAHGPGCTCPDCDIPF